MNNFNSDILAYINALNTKNNKVLKNYDQQAHQQQMANQPPEGYDPSLPTEIWGLGRRTLGEGVINQGLGSLFAIPKAGFNFAEGLFQPTPDEPFIKKAIEFIPYMGTKAAGAILGLGKSAVEGIGHFVGGKDTDIGKYLEQRAQEPFTDENGDMNWSALNPISLGSKFLPTIAGLGAQTLLLGGVGGAAAGAERVAAGKILANAVKGGETITPALLKGLRIKEGAQAADALNALSKGATTAQSIENLSPELIQSLVKQHTPRFADALNEGAATAQSIENLSPKLIQSLVNKQTSGLTARTLQDPMFQQAVTTANLFSQGNQQGMEDMPIQGWIASPEFRDLLNQGYTPQQAKEYMIGKVGVGTALATAPLGAVFGGLSRAGGSMGARMIGGAAPPEAAMLTPAIRATLNRRAIGSMLGEGLGQGTGLAGQQFASNAVIGSQFPFIESTQGVPEMFLTGAAFGAAPHVGRFTTDIFNNTALGNKFNNMSLKDLYNQHINPMDDLRAEGSQLRDYGSALAQGYREGGFGGAMDALKQNMAQDRYGANATGNETWGDIFKGGTRPQGESIIDRLQYATEMATYAGKFGLDATKTGIEALKNANNNDPHYKDWVEKKYSNTGNETWGDIFKGGTRPQGESITDRLQYATEMATNAGKFGFDATKTGIEALKRANNNDPHYKDWVEKKYSNKTSASSNPSANDQPSNTGAEQTRKNKYGLEFRPDSRSSEVERLPLENILDDMDFQKYIDEATVGTTHEDILRQALEDKVLKHKVNEFIYEFKKDFDLSVKKK